ncbi:MAG: VanW family protein [Fimbriimonadaceae bacterium]|nr:VanW family protein [Fimbriimonadaceae bacterium]
MKKLLLFAGLVGLLGAVGLALAAAGYEEVVRPNTYVGVVPVGGLTRDEAAHKLRVWWETEKRRALTLRNDALTRTPPPMRPSELGVALDDQQSVAELPYQDFWQNAGQRLGASNPDRTVVNPVFKTLAAGYDALRDFIRDNAGRPSPATVRYVDGRIERTPEVSGFRLDEAKLPEAIVAALKGDGTIDVPLIEADKRVPDAALDQVVEVVSEFSTAFPASQFNRNENIRLAAGRLDGVVLMPGDSVSFNSTVGKRTLADGFKEAGVYVNGRHDTGVGGGICQVSTTLYNAALFANLKVKNRRNHSMPVAYVPIGRDATVDYGLIDLVLENPYDTPVAVTSEYQRGRLFFRILGKKDPSLEIKIVSDGHKSWSLGEKIVKDPSVPPGKEVVIEKGSMGHSVNTYRIVYRNGVEVAREPLGKSYYRGGQKIIAVNPEDAAPPEGGEAPTPPPADSTVAPVGSPGR